MLKKCQYCGSSFEDKSANSIGKWCGEVCRKRWQRKTKGGVRTMKEIGNLETQELLEELSKRGFISVSSSSRDILVDRHYAFPRALKPFKLGVISDTHLGSTCQQLTLLREAYKICKAEGIKTVLHAGDVTEGNGKLFRGQIYEMFLHGADATVDYVTKVYPRIPGITTHLIGGSHDYSFFKEEGTDILKKISEERKDIKYLGMFGAWVKFGNIVIYLMHGSGGVAYARSYKMQKIIEQMTPGKKPHILFLGHYHTQNHLPNYRNVVGFQLPCFQTQTHYLRAKGLSPEIGFLVVTIYPNVKGIFHYTVDFKPFHNPVDGDY